MQGFGGLSSYHALGFWLMLIRETLNLELEILVCYWVRPGNINERKRTWKKNPVRIVMEEDLERVSLTFRAGTKGLFQEVYF